LHTECLMRFWKFILPILASTLCFAQTDRISFIDPGQRVTLTKSLHPNARPQNDLGVVEPSLKLSYMTILMAPSPTQQKALDELLVEQQDRHSPDYHKWLMPQQFADRFGLSQNDLNKVKAWLSSQGFQILSTGGGRNSLIFSGTVGQAESAFGVEIHRYRVNGEDHIANSTPIMIPTALKEIVRSVAGLHDFRPHPANRRRGFGMSGSTHSDYYDGSYLFPNFLAPGDLATIYDIAPLYSGSPVIDGTGQKVAIAGQTDILLADINDFRSGFGLNTIPTGSGGCTTTTTGTVGIIIGPCDTTYFSYVLVGSDSLTISTDDIGEADLDVEWSGAVARGAQIVYVNAPNTSDGVFDALTAVINPPSGPPLAFIVSASYGEGCEAQATLDLESVFQQGSLEGVTILIASGDIGAAGCDYNPPNANPPYSAAAGGLGVSYPASSPEVTAVGGTEITLADDPNPAAAPYWSPTIGANGGTALTYIPEISWNDDEQLGQFCAENIGNSQFASLCDPAASGASHPVQVTNAQTFQEDYWISSSSGGASNCWYETGTTCLGSGAGPTGGGFAQPLWQQTLVVPSAPTGVRYVPDVSLMGSPNFPGYVFCTPQDPPSVTASTCVNGVFTAVDTYESLVGGTSVSSPVFAGMVALLNQYLDTTSGLGNVNTMLYALAATPSNKAFHPVTIGDNDVYCQPATPLGQPSNVQCPATGTAIVGYSAANADPTTGYNLVTGLGSVDVNALAQAWKDTLTPDFALSASPSTVSIVAGHSTPITLTINPISGSTGTVVNFSPSSCTNLPSGASCSFSPSSVTFDGTDPATTQLTISTLADMALPSTAQTITITPTSPTNVSTTISLTITPTDQSFTIAPTSGTASYSVAAGGTASVQITVTPTNGFSTSLLPLSFTCSALPSETTGSFSPGTGTCAGGSSISTNTVTLTLVTTAPTAQLRSPLGRGNRIFYAMLLPGLFGVMLVSGSRRGARLLGLIVVLGFSTLWLGSCGGSSGGGTKNPGTPAGTYSIVVNATTGAPTGGTALTGTFTIMLTVQ
jgi:subtilase family serine protease